MREFQLFRYLKKWMPFIILFFFVMTLMAYYFLSGSQEYVATAVIRYSNDRAAEGLAPDGSRIDTSEINSAANMAKAMENLGLSGSYSVDRFCSSITVTPIVKEEDLAVQTALNEQGEKSVEEPTVYSVTCTMGSGIAGASTDLVRDVLNELLDVYSSEYSAKHINRTYISNKVKGIQVDEYDYLDVTNQISDLLNDTIDKLYEYSEKSDGFRSASTGYSFKDLQSDFEMLQKVNVYKLYSLILGNKLSKNTDVLISKYLDESARHELESTTAEEDLSETDRVINTYVDKMRSSGNTYSDYTEDYNYILDNVYDNYRDSSSASGGTKTEEIDHTVEYDTLLSNWAKAKTKADHATVDKDYCRFILSTYGYYKPIEVVQQNEDGTTVTTLQPASPYSVISSSATAEEIEEQISTLMERLSELYAIADETNSEYNDYLGAQNIQTLTSVTAGTTINIRLYMIIVAVVFLIIGCGAAVLLGRIGDILEYVFLRDRLTGCMNRVACDNFISEKAKESAMRSSFCCLSLQLRNQHEINRELGREEADRILQTFGRVLREMVENRSESFVGYNGSGQFWAFFDLDASEDSIAPELERLVTVINDQAGSYPVAYSLGGVNAREAGTYNIRSLISKATALRKDHLTVEPKSGEEQQADAEKV